MRRVDPPKKKVKSEEEDDRLPKWDTPSTKPKVDWETSILTLKKTVSSLSEPPESATFRSLKFPSSLLHAKADLASKSHLRTRSCGRTPPVRVASPSYAAARSPMLPWGRVATSSRP
jgi:hypothetical protein